MGISGINSGKPMKIVALSDTHNYNEEIKVPDGDILIHGGDATMSGSQLEFAKFAEWFSGLPHKHKILVAGNHDFGLQSPYKKKILDMFRGVTYLEDEFTEIEGIKIYGSPWSVEFGPWAFMKPESELKQVWSHIPPILDILIVHGPPYGLLNSVPNKGPVGSYSLREALSRLKPNNLLFGHIHEGYGQMIHEGIKCYNISVCDRYYSPVNKVTEFEV